MATLGFTDNDGADLGTKYVTKEYVMDWYPDLVPNMITPELWTWGYNNYGALGTSDTTNRSSPVTTAAGGTNWKQVAVGSAITAAIKTDGTLWTWGYGQFGQLGTNTTSNYSSPVTIAGGGTNWKQVSCGNSFMAAIKTDGTLWAWGGARLTGDGTSITRSSPVTTAGGGTNWKQVACGFQHTAAIKSDGTLWTWGYGDYGALGTNITLSRSSPGTTAGGGTDWKQVACGYHHTAAIKSDGTLWAWGWNNYGQLGDNNTTISNLSPVTTAGGGTNWKQVACSKTHTAALKTDGTLWTWGYNSDGQLGNGTTTSRSSPGTTAGGGTNWKQVSCGFSFTAAIKTDGTLWTWGNNTYGQLGTGLAFDNKSSPVTTVAGGTNWKQVACQCSDYKTAAISESEGW